MIIDWWDCAWNALCAIEMSAIRRGGMGQGPRSGTVLVRAQRLHMRVDSVAVREVCWQWNGWVYVVVAC